MKLALLMLVAFLIAFSGCTQTGEVINKTLPDEGAELNETNITAPENITQEQETTSEEPTDPCAGVVCGETITTCPDGFVSTCMNTCDPETGECVSCKPDCTGHEKTEQEQCDMECDFTKCEVLDEEECECKISLFCDGNGICEPGEYPGSEDCPECDDGDPCTQDSYDYELSSCAYESIFPCCGNMECEEGETEESCPDDCLEEQVGDARITYINYDAPGDDRKKENWNGEWVELEGYNVDMTDWTIEDEANHVYTFPIFMINGKVRLHSGDGENNETDLFWNGGRRPIWNNDGDIATLKDNNGEIVDIYSY